MDQELRKIAEEKEEIEKKKKKTAKNELCFKKLKNKSVSTQLQVAKEEKIQK